jgi:hypothetical protein
MSSLHTLARFLIISSGLFLAVDASAATYTCGQNGSNNSCSPTTMTSLVSSANDGDTIVIANGTHSWTSGAPVTINKRITVRGGGTYAVNASYGDTGSWPTVLTTGSTTAFRINVTGGGSGAVVVSGLHFSGNPSFSYLFGDGNGGMFVNIYGSNVAQYRIHNNKFHSSGGNCGIYANSEGLIDHNYFRADSQDGHCIMVQKWGASRMGDEQWAEPTGWGTADFLFIEDNTFWRPAVSGQLPFQNNAVDAYVGGKYVFRHNYVENGGVINHDKSGGGWTRAGVAFEVYQNHFNYSDSDSWQTVFFLRDGSLLFWGNEITGRYQSWVKLWNQRQSNSQGSWGVCDGSKAWDGPGGYPCADQVGRGRAAGIGPNSTQPQASMPVRIWGNTGTSTGGCSGTVQQGGKVCNASPNTIVAGRDYIFSADNSAAQPGYSPYAYPHPLQSGSTGGGSGGNAPQAPTNLRIISSQE